MATTLFLSVESRADPKGDSVQKKSTPASAAEVYDLELRVVGAQTQKKAYVDAALKMLKGDLVALPFNHFTQLDYHRKSLKKGEKIALEFPGKKAKKPEKNFLEVHAHGQQPNKKLRFGLSIAQRNFHTLVALNNGATLMVAGPKHEKETLLFVITARTQAPKK